MAITNGILYGFYENIANKDVRGGVLDPTEFDNLLKQYSLTYFNEKMMLFEKDDSNTNSLQKLIVSTGSTSLSGFEIDLTGLSNTYAKFSRIRFTDASNNSYNADLVTQMQLDDIQDDYLMKPTKEEPVCLVYSDKIEIFPQPSISDYSTYNLVYIKYPDVPVYDYYINTSHEIEYLNVNENHVWETGEIDSSGNTKTAQTPIVISGITDNGDGTVRLTLASPVTLSSGEYVYIAGTTDYNGFKQVAADASATTLVDITDTYTSEQSGTVVTEVYESTSVELEFPDIDKIEIFTRMMAAIGIKIGSQELFQYGNMETAKLEQK